MKMRLAEGPIIDPDLWNDRTRHTNESSLRWYRNRKEVIPLLSLLRTVNHSQALGREIRGVVAFEEQQHICYYRRLIGNLDAWQIWKGSEIYYFLTKLLTRSGGFQDYLHKIGKARYPDYVLSNGVVDYQLYLFSSGRWYGIHQQLHTDTGELFPNSILREVLKGTDRWSRVAP